jgi:hypothetical protein
MAVPESITMPAISPRSGRRTKAWGGAQRNPRIKELCGIARVAGDGTEYPRHPGTISGEVAGCQESRADSGGEPKPAAGTYKAQGGPADYPVLRAWRRG